MKYPHPMALAVAAVTFLLMPVAVAQDGAGTWYVGFSIDNVQVDGYCDSRTACDDETTGETIYGGYNLHENFAVEIGSGGLGEPEDTTVYDTTNFGDFTLAQKHELKTFYGAVVGKINVNERFSLFGKAGVHRWDVESGLTINNSTTIQDDGVDLFYGIGGQVSLSPGNEWKVVAGYQIFKLSDAYKGQVVTLDRIPIGSAGTDRDIKQLSLGLTYTF